MITRRFSCLKGVVMTKTLEERATEVASRWQYVPGIQADTGFPGRWQFKFKKGDAEVMGHLIADQAVKIKELGARDEMWKTLSKQGRARKCPNCGE